MNKNIFYKIAQELYQNNIVSEDTYNSYLQFLIANKQNILDKVVLLERASGDFNVNVGDLESKSPEDIAYFYNNINAGLNRFNINNYLNNPETQNAFETLKRSFSQMYRPLENVNQYLKQEKRNQEFYQNSNYKESPKVLEDIDDQLNINQSDEAPIQRRPPQVSKLDQLINKVNQEAKNLSEKMYTELINTNLDEDTRNAKLTFFNNIGNVFKNAAYTLNEYVDYSKQEINKKTYPAKQAINALVGRGVITSVELSNRLPNIKSALDLLYSIK